MTKTIPLVLVVLLTAAVAVGGTYWYVKRPPKAQVTVESIEKIAKLATIQYRVSSHYRYKSGETKLTKRDHLYMVRGILEGKVNLKKAEIRIDKGDDGGGQVFITFGPGSVEVSQLAEEEGGLERIVIDEPKELLKRRLSDEQVKSLWNRVRQDARQAAIDDGIADKTQGEAKVLIEQFVAALGWSAIIEFDEGAFAP